MALTRKLLSALNIESDAIEEIIKAHLETVNELKDERDEYKEKADTLKNVQKELDDLKKVSEQTDGDIWQEKYNDLLKEYNEYKTQVAADRVNEARKSLYRSALINENIAPDMIDDIIRVADIDSLELSDGLDEFKDAESVKSSIREKFGKFVTKSESGGIDVPHTEGGGPTKMSKADIMAIKDPAARQKAISENMDVFVGSKQ